MQKKDDIVVGLDIGTTKICVIIAEVDNSGKIKVIGVGNSPSRGLRKGVVVNLGKTVESIENALEEAELMAGVNVDSAYVGIAGDHIRSINSEGVIAISRSNNNRITDDNEITEEDIRRVIDAAKAVSLPIDREILHILPQEFVVDDRYGIKDPIGLSGIRLQAKVHIVTGAITSAKNIYKSVKRAGINVKDLVLEPLASSYAVLTDDEKELGVGLMDIGGGTTDIAMFFEGGVRHTSVLGLGGENVTNDIAMMIRVPLDQAERIKRVHGCAKKSLVSNNEFFKVPSFSGRPPREISRELLSSYIEPRMDEILSLGLREMKKSDRFEFMTAGIVITGGGALLEGTVELAEEIFDMPVKIGIPTGFSGLTDLVVNPMYSTAIGLILYGSKHNGEIGSFRGDDSRFFEKILMRMKKWLNDFF
ncbi:MAG: cell division protein FtsA [Fidelibacterota bacterium]